MPRTRASRIRRAVLALTTAGAVAVGGVALVATSGTADAQPRTSTFSSPPKANEQDADADVTLTGQGLRKGESRRPDSYVVDYTVTNTSDRTADYSADVAFYDVHGNRLGTTGVVADDLGAGESVTGEVAPLRSEIDGGRVGDVRTAAVIDVTRVTP